MAWKDNLLDPMLTVGNRQNCTDTGRGGDVARAPKHSLTTAGVPTHGLTQIKS